MVCFYHQIYIQFTIKILKCSLMFLLHKLGSDSDEISKHLKGHSAPRVGHVTFLLKGHSGQPVGHVTFLLKGHSGQPVGHVTFLLPEVSAAGPKQGVRVLLLSNWSPPDDLF